MPRLNDPLEPNNMPNTTYNVAVTVTVKTWPAANEPMTDYSIAAVFDPTLPANFLSVDSTGHFIAAMTSAQSGPPLNLPIRFISGPVAQGDQIVFTFSGSTGFTVTDVTGLTGLLGGLAWGQKTTADGLTSITATVTAAPVTVGKTHSEYGIVMQKAIAGSPPTFETATIDPDFETDVA